jgi:succinate dehydrogenase / fumarate reductase flavoprotein subunit
MSEAARGEGGRVWVPKDPSDRREPSRIPEAERWYFLEDWYPAYGNTVPRDIASRAIWRVCRELGQGIGGGDRVYLDLTHLDRDFVETRLGAILSIYRKFAGTDPLTTPMEIFPAAHYAMGGLWVDFEHDPASGGVTPGSPRNHATSIPGLYACGECDYGYHGANRLGANSLLSASYSGRVAGEAVLSHLAGIERGADALPAAHFEAEVARQEGINRELMAAQGSESPYLLHDALGALMTSRVGVVRDNASLDLALDELAELDRRAARMALGEASTWANQTLAHARQVQDMIRLARVMAASARARDECRGAHYKPEFDLPLPSAREADSPDWEHYRERWRAGNERWLKTTVAEHTAEGPHIEFEPVDLSVLAPDQPRDYR